MFCALLSRIATNLNMIPYTDTALWGKLEHVNTGEINILEEAQVFHRNFSLAYPMGLWTFHPRFFSIPTVIS